MIGFDNQPPRILRLSEVLSRFPVSKSTWWNGVKAGIYPKQVSLGPRAVGWLESEINDLILNSLKRASNGN